MQSRLHRSTIFERRDSAGPTTIRDSLGMNRDDEKRLGTTKCRAPALPDGEAQRAGVRSERLSFHRKSVPGCAPGNPEGRGMPRPAASRRMNSAGVAPFGTKQTSCESGLSQFGSPASRAISRTSGFVSSPSGKRARESCSAVRS